MVGLSVLQVVVVVVQMVVLIGMFEVQLMLVYVIIYLVIVLKLNVVIMVLVVVMNDIKVGKVGLVLVYLCDGYYFGVVVLGNVQGYKYFYDDLDGVVVQ